MLTGMQSSSACICDRKIKSSRLSPCHSFGMYWLAALPKRTSPRRSRCELPNDIFLLYLTICPCASRRGRADDSNLVVLFLTLNTVTQHLFSRHSSAEDTLLPRTLFCQGHSFLKDTLQPRHSLPSFDSFHKSFLSRLHWFCGNKRHFKIHSLCFFPYIQPSF